MTASVFWSTVEYNRNHYGNAYVWIQGAGQDMKLWILPSDRVQMWYDDAKILPELPDIFYLYSDGGKTYYHFDATPRKGSGDDFCLVTDAFLDAYSNSHGKCHNRNKSLYPATPVA
jgi:hypothetical protein